MHTGDLDYEASGTTLVMDDAVVDAPPGPSRRLPRLGFRDAGEAGSDSPASIALAFLLTAALLAGAGLSVGSALGWEAAGAPTHEHETERLVYITTPEAAAPIEPLPARPAADATNRLGERQIPRPAGSPAATASRDTLGASTAAQPPLTSPRAFPLGPVPGSALPSPSRLGEAIGTVGARGARTGCAAPCREAAVAGAAPGSELARRDSMLQSKAQEVVDRAGPPQLPPGFQIGLPGGGPTKEERQRDSTLHAEYRKRLEALLSRYDSLKADSIARELIKKPPRR